jgi:hypothetical protein
MKNLDLLDFREELLDSIRGEGEPIVFSQEEAQKERKDYFNLSQESLREERYRRAKARASASKIYLD